MHFKVVCNVCGEWIWVSGSEERDTGAVNLKENALSWADACEHIQNGGDYTISDSEIDDEY